MNRADFQSPRRVFRVPFVLGVLTAFGLVSALVGDDAWDALSWAALLVPLAAVVIAWRRRVR